MPAPTIRRRPFTLIELLVVVAIISILAAMLLPALQRAKGAASDASCDNNLKQNGIAITLYADDYDGYPPNECNMFAGTPNVYPWFIKLRDGRYTPNMWPSQQVSRPSGLGYTTNADGSYVNGYDSCPPPRGTIGWCPSAEWTIEERGPGQAWGNNYYHDQGSYLNVAASGYVLNPWLTTDASGFWGHYGSGGQPWGRYTFTALADEASQVLLLGCLPGNMSLQSYPTTYIDYEDTRNPAAWIGAFDHNINGRHRDHWNAQHWDLHVSSYHEAKKSQYQGNGVYPWFPRRAGGAGGATVKMPDFTRSVTMITLQ